MVLNISEICRFGTAKLWIFLAISCDQTVSFECCKQQEPTFSFQAAVMHVLRPRHDRGSFEKCQADGVTNKGHFGPVHTLAFAGNGTAMASGSEARFFEDVFWGPLISFLAFFPCRHFGRSLFQVSAIKRFQCLVLCLTAEKLRNFSQDGFVRVHIFEKEALQGLLR